MHCLAAGSVQGDMVMAARIFGDQVGSTAPVFLAFLAVHVLAGLTAVVTGAIAALVRKGSPLHIRAGRWYYRAITLVFATATVLAAMRTPTGMGQAQARLMIRAAPQQAPTTGPVARSLRAARRAGLARVNAATMTCGSPNSANAALVAASEPRRCSM